jgi:hypothetical protein
MNAIIPKETIDEDWEKLTPHTSYAVLCSEDQHIYIKVGSGKSFYFSIRAFKGGARVLNSIQYESGEESLLFKVPYKSPMSLGRADECTIKVMHSIVSRKHLDLSLEDNILVIRDYGSTNGTYIFKANIYFSIDDYLAHHSLEHGAQETLDEVHQTFGATLDDFLRSYVATKEQEHLKLSKEENNHERNNDGEQPPKSDNPEEEKLL